MTSGAPPTPQIPILATERVSPKCIIPGRKLRRSEITPRRLLRITRRSPGLNLVERRSTGAQPGRTQIDRRKDMTSINQTGFLSLTLLTTSLALLGMARSTLTEFDAPGAAIPRA